jgi:predicted protein tyrosine phosphatase
LNVLFVCSRNQWRSPTAEAIFKNNSLHVVKSAGTEPSARVKVTAKLMQWADLVFVMEKKHKERLIQRFAEMREKKIVILDIPDEYQFMDAELIEVIKVSTAPYL